MCVCVCVCVCAYGFPNHHTKPKVEISAENRRTKVVRWQSWWHWGLWAQLRAGLLSYSSMFFNGNSFSPWDWVSTGKHSKTWTVIFITLWYTTRVPSLKHAETQAFMHNPNLGAGSQPPFNGWDKGVKIQPAAFGVASLIEPGKYSNFWLGLMRDISW